MPSFYRCFLKKMHYKKTGNHWNIQKVYVFLSKKLN
jgi:hypothetical protein